MRVAEHDNIKMVGFDYVADAADFVYDNDPTGCDTWLNLTNGVEVFDYIHDKSFRPNFMRVQSTSLEQKLFDKVVSDIPADFIMRMVMGCDQYIVDFGAHHTVPRALWQGIPYFVAAYKLVNYGEHDLYFGRRNCGDFLKVGEPDFSKMMRLDDKTVAALRYYGRYDRGLGNIIMVCAKTYNDGNYEHFCGICR